MVEEIKLILNKIIYDELNLKLLEEEFKRIGIKSKDIYNPHNLELASEYFFLMNDLNMESLSNAEKQQIISYYNESKLGNIQSKNMLYEILKQKKLQLLLPNTDQKYLCYGSNSSKLMAPSDAIVLGFHYIRYNDEFDPESDFKKEYIINERINYIQEYIAPSKNFKVAILKYDEISNDLGRKL